ncbi:lamin tail domain-containing protein [Luteolibacter pohnpeiensis]|uniref:lamin tail domain-containing protein n=1 Tax=Luteolibacter pohnpeiensis TaxID=454153 RepID=UPI001904050D|nr:lamin tail domain-containing protein [Luteolibacter pohnpeiensis]
MSGILGFSLISGGFAQPVITEFMADNETTIPDEDGDYSDWIEIHNPTTSSISLANWCLTDKSSNLTQWKFPAVSLAPGEFLVVWASGKNRRTAGSPLHTNFSLSKGGEFLALVRPDESIEQSFDPGFPAQAPDESYGLRFQSTAVLAEGATGKYQVPTRNKDPSSDWIQAAYDDSAWASGPSGFGYGITVPGITVRQVSKNGSIGGLSDALNVLAQPEGSSLVYSSTSGVYSTVNFMSDGPESHFAFSNVPPGGGGENYVLEATGYVYIPTAGLYTFGQNTDDGGRILIDGSEIMRDDMFHSPADRFGVVSLTAGYHSFQSVMFEGGGGDCLEFFAAPGSHTSFDESVFRLVGDVANGGLAATTTPAGTSTLIGTDVSSVMSGKPGVYLRMPFSSEVASATAASLVMRYDDGFVAWLDGVKMASGNAPTSPAWNSLASATRGSGDALRRSGYNFTAGLPALQSGSHVLAIQGLKSSTTDGSFLALPELILGNLDQTLAPAAYGDGLATPGWINGSPSSLGTVEPVEFSVDRGIFDAPFNLQISTPTPGAVIRYTTNGSIPDETNGVTYTGPLSVSATTVLRVRAILTDWEPTEVVTQTYVFPADVIRQSPTGSTPRNWPNTSGTDQVLDYGMDPEIVDHTNPDIGGEETIKAALKAIPTVSLTTEMSNLFNINGSQGIYSNPGSRGFAWERPASIEWINPPDETHPNGTSEFQVNAGLRIRGGYSRSTDNPKHSFRLFFREDYGPTKLEYPLFGDEAAQEFDKIDLRTAQNYSWSFEGDTRNTFLREESSRQAIFDMGQPGSHVRYFHLYLNGQYWGLYDLDERTEAAFSETYFGGDKDEYDVVKSDSDNGWIISATDGSLEAWQDLWDASKAHAASPTNANYFKMMGLAADGVTPTDDPVLLDDDNLIDYMLLTFWMGNRDGSLMAGENGRSNNWFASRQRENNPGQGFQFFVHDFEHSMLSLSEDRTGPFHSDFETNFDYSSPYFLHQDLTGNAEYRMRWADHVQQFMFNSGALTGEAWQNRFSKLSAFVDTSIAAESARWGDAQSSTPLTRNNWVSAQNELVTYAAQRNAIVLSQLKADGLYPALDAPILFPFGGTQPLGTEVTIQGAAGATIYYMPDGSDPRAIGGGLKTGAQIYTASTTSEFLIPWSSGEWSYLSDGSNQGTAWRSASFDSRTWAKGYTEIGYGDGDEATVLPIVDADPATAGTQKVATYYFRKTFDMADAASATALSLTIEYDDAYAVYLNGSRIAGNLPLDPAFDYYTNSAIEDTIETLSIPPSLLLEGRNTIAVEIHQANASSSDLSMNLSLAAVRSATATPIYLSEVGQKTLRIRAKNDTEWSALVVADYQVGTALPQPGQLVISEISYHPQDPHDEAEFLEILNVGGSALDLSGATFTDGIDFTFPQGSTIDVDERMVLVRNADAFAELYGSVPVAGVFENDTALSNGGERLILESADGVTLLDFEFGTEFPWPLSADGLGRSLVLTDVSSPGDPRSWRPSREANGSPGSSDSFSRAPGQDLLDYALAEPTPQLNPANGEFSISRKLGADEVILFPEWSADLLNWSSASVSLIAETPDASGNSTLTWKLEPLPSGQGFFRLRVVEKQ